MTELLSLPAAALATDAAMLLIKGKGGRERIVPLSDAAKDAAWPCAPATGAKSRRYLFAGRDPRSSR